MKKDREGLVVILICLVVLVVILSGIWIYVNFDKLFGNKDKTDDEIDGIVNPNPVQRKVYGYTYKTQVGEFVISKDGDVYFIPSDSVKINEEIATYGKYSVTDVYPTKPGETGEFEGYKLNISDVKSAKHIQLGNGGISSAVVFIHFDGTISELAIVENNEAVEYSLTKKVSGYTNIVSVVQNNSDTAGYALLINNRGKAYEYFGSNLSSTNVIDTEYALLAGVGKIYVTKDGEVYYMPSKDWQPEFAPNFGELDLEVISTDYVMDGNYTVAMKDNNDTFDGYKINVANAQAAYSVVRGNGAANESIIIVGKDGKISDLKFEKVSSGKVNVTFTRNVSGYTNIVDVAQNSTWSGNSIMLFDEYGNEYIYD